MSQSETKNAVGQLTFTFGFNEQKDEVQETQDNGPQTSLTAALSPSKPERKRKWHSLYDKVYALPNLERAWQRVAENHGAAGADGVSVPTYSRNVEERLLALSQDLCDKTYRPQALRRVFIAKSGGGKRALGIPTVRDRIVQQAINQILEPIFEPVFSSRSHGFRPGRGCQTAVGVVDRALGHGYTWVVDADIASFFDTVDHDLLLTALNEQVADGSLLRLIRYILEAGVVMPSSSEVEPTDLGTPQGGPLSPLLANVFLHRFDLRMVQAGYGLVRYADDFVIFTKSEGEAEAALDLARQVLEGELGLHLHPEKTRIVSVEAGFEFLGFHYFRDPQSGIKCKEVRPKSAQRFRDAIRERTPRLRAQRRVKPKHVRFSRLVKNQRVTEMIKRVNVYLRGWHAYFKDVCYPDPIPFRRFDSFVRRRVRLAITGRIGNGWWNPALPNRLLSQLGLRSLDELQAQYKASQQAARTR